MTTSGGIAAILVACVLVTVSGAAAGALGTVTGRVPLPSDADRTTTVVYLDGERGPLAYDVPTELLNLSQRGGAFSPSLLVVAAGQSVGMPNDDNVVHSVFSLSKPNDFDLGLYPSGVQKVVRFETPGVVDVYCSIHVNMRATIFVAPSPWYARPDASGAFTIAGVPPGRYRVKAWSRAGEHLGHVIDVKAGEIHTVDLLPLTDGRAG